MRLFTSAIPLVQLVVEPPQQRLLARVPELLKALHCVLQSAFVLRALLAFHRELLGEVSGRDPP